MEIPSTSTIAAIGGSGILGGGLVGWFVKYQIKRVLDAIEKLPKDIVNLSKKIDETKNEIEEKIHDEVATVKDKFNDLKTELKIDSARMDERIKFLEAKK